MTLDRALLLDLSRRLEYPAHGDARLQEAYTAAFELAPVASPYLGDHLFGPSAARHLFLAKVKRLLAAAGVDPGAELPDHLSVVLRLAAVAPRSREIDELLADGALPAARAMHAALESAGNPWAGVLADTVAALASAAVDGAPAGAEVTP